MTVLAAFSERALQPLDGLRRLCLRAAVRVPPFRRLVTRREARVPALLLVHALAAFALALFVPSLLLGFAPLVLGVPHAAADVRHLVLRRGLPRWWAFAVGVVSAALILLRVLEETATLSRAAFRIEHGVGTLWILGAVFAGARVREQRRPVKMMALIAGSLAIGIFSLCRPQLFRLVFAHAHNVFAVGIWLLLFRRRTRHIWLPVIFVFAGAAVLTSGLPLPLTIRHGALSVAGLHLFAAADWLAPGLPDTQAIGLTMAFAFLQSVHYAIWLGAIPRDDDRAERGSFTFRKAGRALARDFSPIGVMVIVAAAAVVLAGAAISPRTTRNLFLSLVTFHAWLEFALLAFFAARGGIGDRDAAAEKSRGACS